MREDIRDCPYKRKCGGCRYAGEPYEAQLKRKETYVRKLLEPFCRVAPAVGMEDPYYYRNKVHAVFGQGKKGSLVCGIYREGTHEIIPVDHCLLENERASAIIQDIRVLAESFRLPVYNEDTGRGLLRHVLVRTGHATGQVLVVLVTGSPVFPSRKNFTAALRRQHPEISSIVQNINDRRTSMVLGKREQVLWGKGYIEDVLCGYRFRISSSSFYQINSVQTEKLYTKAIALAGLTGKEAVIDAYCGIGTIGMTASKHAGKVTGIELNGDAVRDARANAAANRVANIRFLEGDAGEYMEKLAARGETADVLFTDPPRSGCSEQFLRSAVRMGPKRIVYISCEPETLARDLKILTKAGYEAEGAWPYDLFCLTPHVETVCLLSNRKPDTKVRIDVDLEDYYRIKGSFIRK